MKSVITILLCFIHSAYSVNDLLVLHCENGASIARVQSNIGSNPFFGSVDYIDGSFGLVPLTILLNYECVFTWNTYSYIDGQGDALADYVDAGGSVVICGWAIAQCDGRILDDPDYCPMDGGSNRTTPVNLVPVNPHDIMSGVSSITGITFWVNTTMEPGAYLIAENSLGIPLAAINTSNRIIALNMVAGDYIFWSGDGWVLMNNSIEFLMSYVSIDATTWGDIKAVF